jgi:hypothetical protein
VARDGATRLVALLTLAAATLAVVVPGAQAKTSWSVDATVSNRIASTASTCANVSLFGCVNADLWTGVGDVDDVNPPRDVAAGADGSFSFTSPSLVEGGDLYVDYTMPTGSKYEAIVEDDDHVSGYMGAGNYVGCTQVAPQGDSAAVCSAQWGGTYEAMTPTFTFGPSSQAPLPSVGQRCSGTMGWEVVLIDCMDTKQFGPADPSQKMWVSFRTITPGPVYVQQQTGGPNCRMGQGYPSTCSILMQPGKSLQIGSLNNTGDATYTVEIMSTASGYDVPDGLVPDPNPQSTAAPAVRALTVAPGTVRPASSGAPVAQRATKGRGARIRYRSSQDVTTVFTLARATRGGWRTLPGRTANADLVGSGVKRRGRCVRTSSGARTGSPCRYRSRLRGHFLHHGQAGVNAVRFTGRLAGKRLPAGRYRLTAQARHHRTGKLSVPVAERFRVAR